MSMVSLPDELLLLAYDDASGRSAVDRNSLDHGLAGAVLLELALAERIDVIEGRVTVLEHDPTGDSLLDSALERIAADRRARKPQVWVNRLRRGLREDALARLVAAGVVRRDTHRLLGLIPMTAYPAAKAQPEVDAGGRLAAVVLQHQLAEPGTAALVSLVLACRMDRKVFKDAPRREVRRRMKEVSEGDWAGPAVRKAIDAVNAGVAAAVAGGAAAGGGGG